MNANDQKYTTAGTEGESIQQLLDGFDDRFEKIEEELRKNTSAKDKVLDVGWW